MHVRLRGLNQHARNQLFPISLAVAADIPDASPMSFDVTDDGTYFEINALLGLVFADRALVNVARLLDEAAQAMLQVRGRDS